MLEIGKELSSLYRRLGNESAELRATLNYAESLHAFGVREALLQAGAALAPTDAIAEALKS